MAIRVFPVAEEAGPTFADRYVGGGSNIFAPLGSAVLAVDSGTATAHHHPEAGGLVVHLEANDGTRYDYEHLNAFEGLFPRTVEPGEPLGQLGNSGSAKDEEPHLHFEIHPLGAVDTLDPFPALVNVAPGASIRLPVPFLPVPGVMQAPTSDFQPGRRSSARYARSSSSRSSSGGAAVVVLGLLWLLGKKGKRGRIP